MSAWRVYQAWDRRIFSWLSSLANIRDDFETEAIQLNFERC